MGEQMSASQALGIIEWDGANESDTYNRLKDLAYPDAEILAREVESAYTQAEELSARLQGMLANYAEEEERNG